MKVLVSFQPNKKESSFEGVRLRKTIKGALEMVDVSYTNSPLDDYDVAHLISPEEDDIIPLIKNKNVPIIASALFCEDDPSASYLEHKNKDGKIITNVKSKAIKFLNKVDLVLVPSIYARDILINAGIRARIMIALPGVNLSRFNFSRDDEKEIFYRYFTESKKRPLVVSLGEFNRKFDGASTVIAAAKKCPNVNFYYFGKETTKGYLRSFKMRQLLKIAPKNVHFETLIADDVYRSALLNAEIFFIPSYKTTGVVSLLDAMAGKCQIIARKNAVYEDIIKDGENAYIGAYSETLTSLIKDYFDKKIASTIENGYELAKKCNLKTVGEQLLFFYQQEINNKNI